VQDIPKSVRIACGEDYSGRYTILSETKKRWNTSVMSKAIVHSCNNERLLRQAVISAVQRADEEGPLRADQLAEELSTGMFTVNYETEIDATTD